MLLVESLYNVFLALEKSCHCKDCMNRHIVEIRVSQEDLLAKYVNFNTSQIVNREDFLIEIGNLASCTENCERTTCSTAYFQSDEVRLAL